MVRIDDYGDCNRPAIRIDPRASEAMENYLVRYAVLVIFVYGLIGGSPAFAQCPYQNSMYLMQLSMEFTRRASEEANDRDMVAACNTAMEVVRINEQLLSMYQWCGDQISASRTLSSLRSVRSLARSYCGG